MIKINLLPKKPRPLTVLWKDLTILGGITIILTISLFIMVYNLKNKVNYLKKDALSIKKQIESSKIDIEKINQLKKDKAILENKISIIASLREKQSWPVYMLDDLSSAIPDHIWLNSMSNQDESIKLEGITPSYNAVSDFMRRLESSPYFKSIELENIQQSMIQGKNFHKFKISCLIEFLPQEGKEKREKG